MTTAIIIVLLVAACAFARVDFKSGAAEVFAKEPLPEFVIRQTVIGVGYSVEEVKQNEL